MTDGAEERRLRRVFEAALADAAAGRGVVSCLGLDCETDDALLAVYDAAIGYRATGSREELVAAARRAFEGQLDGTNAARWHEQLARRFTER
ncbi:hypothetical protein [Streptomyces sp. CBMA123]|uniref:hypothetical protein n=1 Tax=Streptomyces sp. CBMA123 TaxID=1896313 RepID=UPI001661B020|nr:hypothetical protein [Streptomyces sp. CBMA123]MBD0691765.1 hypothetical protein [Streptomyces sp. CBMA123]